MHDATSPCPLVGIPDRYQESKAKLSARRGGGKASTQEHSLHNVSSRTRPRITVYFVPRYRRLELKKVMAAARWIRLQPKFQIFSPCLRRRVHKSAVPSVEQLQQRYATLKQAINGKASRNMQAPLSRFGRFVSDNKCALSTSSLFIEWAL